MTYSFVRITRHHKEGIKMKDEMTALPALKVMGHRTAKALQSNTFNLSRLVVLDSLTLEPVDAVWMYAGETSGVTGSAFIDIAAHKDLSIQSEGYATVTLRPYNVADQQFSMTTGATVLVVKDDHTIDGWGPGYPSIPVPAEENHNVAMVHPGDSAVSALRYDHSVFAWGYPPNGGELKPGDADRTDVMDLQMVSGMGLLQGATVPTISQWGKDSDGTNKVPDDISSRIDIRKVVANSQAQVALTQSGQLIEWGSDGAFVLPAEISALTDVQDFYLNDNAGVALRKTGQLATWGIPECGGVLPDDIAALTDVERVIPGMQSFVALREDGSAVCWGQNFELPASMKSLKGIVQAVYGLSEKPLPYDYEGCAVLDSTGQVYSWYGPGVDVPVPAGLSEVVALTTNREYSFAALKSDGSVVAWGTDISGDTTPVRELLTDVQAI
ncbi:hypothetical protein CJP72_10320 [Citrobacter sp. NCU1]|uniref:hypothetical protein n=1 Tax=Citrobacter sp. NCU1 TaxID=2026683 RepID=UPI001390C5B0|nr:hypothetical protein [Citrobacter sp. NCU1]NDO81140.1 hypothetical protein [Citrobacter sp. NCU1]